MTKIGLIAFLLISISLFSFADASDISNNSTFGEGGYFSNDTSVSLELTKEFSLKAFYTYTKSSTGSENTPTIGIGGGYNFLDSFSANLEWSSYRGTDTYKSSTINANGEFIAPIEEIAEIVIKGGFSSTSHSKTINRKTASVGQIDWSIGTTLEFFGFPKFNVNYTYYSYDRDVSKIQQEIARLEGIRIGGLLSIVSGFPSSSISAGLSYSLFIFDFSADYTLTRYAVSNDQLNSYLFSLTTNVLDFISLYGSYNITVDSANTKTNYYSLGASYYF